jgi:hypothetical protein
VLKFQVSQSNFSKGFKISNFGSSYPRVDNVHHTSGYFFIENFIMAEIFQPSVKIKLIFILFQQRTCMIKARPKYPTDLYGTIYINNIQKVVVICLIIPTIFPFDAISSIKNTWMYDVRCPPWDNWIQNWRF